MKEELKNKIIGKMIVDGWNEQSANEMAEYLDLYKHEVITNVVEFIKGKSEKVTEHLWYVSYECLEDVERFFITLTKQEII